MNALQLESIGSLKLRQMPIPEVRDDEILLKVTHCALCRTDVKMWEKGQRDMVLPRILGHEICGFSEEKKRFTVWPGESCGKCRFCQSGFENLCKKMRITGFHKDGGLADYVAVPKTSLIPIPDNMPGEVASLSEPLGCCINAVQQAQIKEGDKVLVYGAGAVGLLMGMAVKAYKAFPFIREINPAKLMKSEKFQHIIGIQRSEVLKDSEIFFDAVINAAPSADTFFNGISHLVSGGCFCLFSGLTDSDYYVPVSAINEIHYRQLRVTGAYGCTRLQQKKGLEILSVYQNEAEMLIEEHIRLQDAPSVFPKIAAGDSLKFVVEFLP